MQSFFLTFLSNTVIKLVFTWFALKKLQLLLNHFLPVLLKNTILTTDLFNKAALHSHAHVLR